MDSLSLYIKGSKYKSQLSYLWNVVLICGDNIHERNHYGKLLISMRVFLEENVSTNTLHLNIIV